VYALAIKLMTSEAIQPLDTVDWSGDGDDADFFRAVEAVFDIRFRSHIPWTTFGEVYDHVIARVPASARDGTICASQMTFYRLRRALGLGRHITPGEPLLPLLGKNIRREFGDLEAETDLKMPPTRAGVFGIAGGICFVAAAAVLTLSTLAPPMRFALAVAGVYFGMWMRSIDSGRLPRGCETLGELANKVAEQNRARLARHGARLTNDEIWRIIQQLAAEEGGQDPGRIGPRTTFFRRQVCVG
jgi:hypothetical protein